MLRSPFFVFSPKEARAKMNLTHVAYAVAIAQNGSVSKAAERLLVAQSNLSRAVKELEDDLGIVIFQRTRSGMIPTVEGERFLTSARSILSQVERLENGTRNKNAEQQPFSLSVARASYITEAFARFLSQLKETPVETNYMETSSYRTVLNVSEGSFNLGIIRYNDCYHASISRLLQDRHLHSMTISTFHYMLLFSKKSPLNDLPEIRLTDLEQMTEIMHPDYFIPERMAAEKGNLTDEPFANEKHVFVYERASQFALLRYNPQMFMWVSPVPGELPDLLNMVQKTCP